MAVTRQPPARFRKSDVLRMFPTCVWKAELEPDVGRQVNEAILAKLGEIEPALADLRTGESWQSGHDLHRRDAFRPLVGCIDRAVEAVLDHLEVGHRDFEITGCWATVNAPGADHRMHSHPNNYLSGVYYVRTDEGANTINFHDPRPQTGVLRPPVTALTADNADQVVVRVEAGTLLMFPAWLPHSVDSNRGEGARVSISFNIMLSSYADTLSKPGWTGGWRRPG